MEKILLIDGHSILHRAFYGMPDLTAKDGRHTGAVYGFLNILFKLLDEEHPDYLAVAFDVHAPTFRHEVYAQYKGTRKPMPEERIFVLRLLRTTNSIFSAAFLRRSLVPNVPCPECAIRCTLLR